MMVFYPQKRSGYIPSGDDPVGAAPVDNKPASDGPRIMQGGGHISAPGGTFTSVDEPAPFDMGGSGVRTVDMPVYDNTNVGLIPKEVVTTEDFGQFSPDAIFNLSTIPPDTMRPKFEIENSYEK